MDKHRALLLRNPLQSAGSLQLPTPSPLLSPPLCTMSWWQVVAAFCNSGYSSSQTQWPVKKPRAYEEKKLWLWKCWDRLVRGLSTKSIQHKKPNPNEKSCCQDHHEVLCCTDVYWTKLKLMSLLSQPPSPLPVDTHSKTQLPGSIIIVPRDTVYAIDIRHSEN